MNRRERRNFFKQVKNKGISKSTAEAYLAIRETGLDKPSLTRKFQEDDSAMLDIDKITSRKTYEKTAENYKSFVEASKGVIFTAHVERENLIGLKENPEWLFWSGDLVKVEKTSGDQTTTENNTVTDSEN